LVTRIPPGTHAPRPPGVLDFDPELAGQSECDSLVAYYRRDWVRFLSNTVRMMRAVFGFGPVSSLFAAWFVLRSCLAWSPVPVNDPALALRELTRFYRLLAGYRGLHFNPAHAARLELEWWRVHRDAQSGSPEARDQRVNALAALYGCVFGADAAATHRAAELKLAAVEYSDQWVAAGRRRLDPLLDAERRSFVESYAALRTPAPTVMAAA
jgi:hypothetical protein